MASITFSDGTVATLSISELIEYKSACQPSVEKVTQAVVKATAKRNSVKAEQVSEPTAERNSDDESNNVNTYSVMANCGHAVLRNSPRGRKPALCSACKNGSEAPEEQENGSEQQQEAPKQQRKGGNRQGGKRNGSGNFAEWLEKNGDKEMTGPMERKIRYFLDAKQVPAKLAKEIRSALDSDQRMNCFKASEYIGKLYKLPKIAA